MTDKHILIFLDNKVSSNLLINLLQILFIIFYLIYFLKKKKKKNLFIYLLNIIYK